MTAKGRDMDLSHWDVAVEFTGDQAAALVIGHDPASDGYARTTSTPIYERMKRCYELKVKWLWGDMGPYEDGIIAIPDMLESTALAWWAHQVEPGSWSDYCQWAKSDAESGFETQRFTRQELVRWLSAINVTSIYQFEPDPANGANACADKLGSRTPKRWTPEMLEKLKACREKQGTKAAAKQFGISDTRVRQLLPGKEAKPTGFGGFPQAKR